MIYFVDEDINETEPFAIELQNRGYQTTILCDADEAFRALLNAKSIKLIFLDVMLATEENGISRYSASETDSFITTGLALLDDLVNQFRQRGDTTIPQKVVLLSAAQRNWVVNKINEKVEEYGIKYWDKKDFDDTFIFAEQVIKLLSK